MIAVCEVDARYRVRGLADALVSALDSHGLALSAPVRQDDQAYAHQNWKYGMRKVGVPFARLRTEGGRHLFTVQRPGGDIARHDEYETEIADRDQMHDAVLAMGFRPTVRVVRSRRTSRSDELSVAVDEVEHVGVFLEVEQVVAPGRCWVEVRAELDRFVRSLGVPVERTTDTYDSLVRVALAAV